MYFPFLLIIIFIILLIILLWVYLKRFNIFIINHVYLIKFLFFNIILFIYYFIYLIVYSIFFILKNYRFFSYYYFSLGTAFLYFNKKSIYFLFWRYLVIYILTTISFFFRFVINIAFIFFSKLCNSWNVNNVYLFLFIYLKIKYLYIPKAFLIKLYNLIITFIYYIFYFINIPHMYFLLNTLKLNLFNRLKYKADPILHRNSILTWSSNLYYIYYKYVNINFSFINIYNLKILYIFKKIFYSLITYVTFLLFYINFDKLYICVKNLLSNIYLLNKSHFNKHIFIKSLKISFYSIIYGINLILINIIYFIFILFIYFVYSIFSFCNRFKYLFLYILLLLFCIKYYWIIYYFFFMLYKHYLFNVPLFEIKESTRFFNFEYIDLRNYFNLIFLRNTLVDLSTFNNIIYNDLLHNLNKTLSSYGFKVGSQYDINLYSLLDVRNKDTKLLNNLLDTYNNSESISLYKWDMLLQKYMIEEVEHNMFDYADNDKPKPSTTFKKVFEKGVAVTGLGSPNLEVEKKDYFFHIGHKENYIIWKFFRKGYYKDKTALAIPLKSVQYIKLNQIPLKYIYLYNDDAYYNLNNSNFIRKYYKYPMVHYFLNRYKQRSIDKTHYFFFNNVYNFENYKDCLNMKHKIPTFQWTSVRWRRKVANLSLYPNTTGISILSEEDQSHEIFFEVARKKLKRKRFFKIFYTNYQYPFSILKKKSIFNVLNENNNINFKIIKKFYFLKNSHMASMRRYYKKLLYSENLLIRLFYNRLNPWDNTFLKNHLKTTCVVKNNSQNVDFFNYNFWFFFDYFKTDKFYYTKYNEFYNNNEFDLNLIFLKRLRKDYIKLRNNLLKMYSLYYYYYLLEAANYKHFFYSNLLPAFMRNDLLYKMYDNFKLSWIFRIYLTKERTNIKLFKNISYLNKLFKFRFFAYFVYCDYTINSYNDLFYIKNTSYRLRVLNKINNLKRFFYFQNKHTNGWSIFKYLNSFSLSYHIKKFLWHSPYSFLLFKDTFIIKGNDFNVLSNFIILYNVRISNKEVLINTENYLILFNLFLNIIEINHGWFYILNYKNIINDQFFLKIFNSYYNNGILTPLSFIDIYRFVMNFLFEYYNNFLYKLIRYRYILNYKNYTFIEFIEHYFYKWFKHIYIRIRLQVYNYTMVGRYFFQKFWYKYLGFKYKDIYSSRAYRKTFIPFWFIHDYYIKLFVFYLLEKYYTKNFFIFYWLNWFNNYLFNNYYLILFYLNFFNLKYLFIKFIYYFSFFFNYNNIFISFCSIVIYHFNKFIMFIYNYLNINNIYYWYISLIFNYDINIFNNFNYVKIFLILKWFFLVINKSLFNIFDINLNKVILIKIYIEKLINYYINIIFNIKNFLVYFKPNNYYYYKQRNFNKWDIEKVIKFNTPFKNTITYRNIYSFRHLTPNITFFNNIYLSNVYNYIYFINMYYLNISNVFNIFFFSLKYNYMYFIFLIYLLFYWIILLLLHLYYKNFYNIFFFTYTINEDPQYNWKKNFNDNVVTMSNSYTNKKNKVYNKVLKKNQNFYKFYFLNTFLNKLSIFQTIWYKVLFFNNKYNNLKIFNNNQIMEVNLKNKKFWKEKLPSIVFFNYLDFFKNFTIMPFKLKKSGFSYNFSFLNYFNNNLFNFCFFYWIILIPYFFFEYVLIKYHLKGHLLIKHKIIFFLKVLLDNFKWYINLYKYFGSGINIVYNPKFVKSDQGYSHNYKQLYRNNIKNVTDHLVPAFHIFDRSVKMHIRLSYLGNYYYWFHKISKMEYFVSFKNYFFNLTYKSVYFSYIYIYVLCWIIITCRYYKNFTLKKTI